MSGFADWDYQHYKQRKKKKKIAACSVPLLLLVVLIVISLFVFIQKPTNNQRIKYRLVTGPMVNPLMGWAPWATIEESQQPHTLVYADLTWRDFEPEEGVYDFEQFEKTQQLDRWRVEGKRVVFRFVVDKPGDQDHMDIPDWLFEKIEGQGDYYSNGYGRGFSPDYSNPVFIESHRRVIEALGNKYGGDDFFAYIELGSLGHWGEWHVNLDSGIRPLPAEAIRDLYVIHYLDYFPHTYLLMRRPFAAAEEFGLGLYNDMTADFDSTMEWLTWINDGGEFSQANDKSPLVPMPDVWKFAPIGGEQSSSMSNNEIYDTYLEQTIRLIRLSHATFIGPHSPYAEESGGTLQAGIDEVLSVLGYRIFIDQVEMPERISLEENMEIKATFGNKGIAPIYYNWPVKLFLMDESGIVLDTFLVEMDLRKLIPEMLDEVSIQVPIDKLENGTYKIGIAIIDPATGQPAVKLAIENERDDLVYELGSFEVKGLFRNLVVLLKDKS